MCEMSVFVKEKGNFSLLMTLLFFFFLKFGLQKKKILDCKEIKSKEVKQFKSVRTPL